ncbi:MAG TPA: lipocalin family protein [Chitinophagaceae bacterium]
MKKSLLLTIVPLVTLLSCGKDPVSPPAPSKAQLLTNGTWKITAIASDDDGNGSYETDDYASFPTCLKDNFYTFKSGGALDMDEAAVKCDPADPQINTTAWQLTQNDNRLMLDGDEYVIDQLNATTLKFKDPAATFGTLFTMTKR